MMDKEMKKSNPKEIFKKIFAWILPMIIGAIVGVLVIVIIWKLGIEFSIGNSSMSTKIIGIILAMVGFILQLILHEAGHLILGIWSGYEFVSFRIGSVTFVKDNGKIVIKKFKIQGTGGQCLMMPPEGNGYDCPYVLYNLGGILMNIIISGLCVAIYVLFSMPQMVKVLLISMALSGIFDFIMNGVPLKIDGITNDGYNVLAIRKDKIARYAFYMQLRVNGLLNMGARIKDMPLKWFQIPDESNLSNHMIASIRILEGNYYHDRKEFDKAKECYENLLNDVPSLIKIYQYEIKCELLFCEIIDKARKEVIDKLYTKDLKKYIKVTDCYISRKRLMYAYALIVERDMEKADKILKEANVVKKTYPVKAEVESEMEIIEFIKEKVSLFK